MPSKIAVDYARNYLEMDKLATCIDSAILERARPLLKAVQAFANAYGKELPMDEHERLWITLFDEARKLQGGS